MALFGKDDRMQRPEDARPFVVGGPSHGEAAAGDPTAQAHLGKGSRIEGRLTFEGSVQIDGQVESAEVIGSALLYPNQGSTSELNSIEGCLDQGVQS